MEKFNEILNANKISIALSLVGIVLVIGGIYLSRPTPKPQAATIYPKESLVKGVSTEEIKVDVSGAVNNPGVYSFTSETRVEDVIKKAGGFSKKANSEYISKSLNLSQKVSDGIKIYVPFEGEISGGVSGGGAVSSLSTTTSGSININSADSKSLDSLPGVGAVTSQKIIDNRPYQSIEELVSKKVVGKSTFEKIKDQISI